jgi:ketosteroid isomerase-like protein
MPQTPAPTEGMKAFVATSRTGSTRVDAPRQDPRELTEVGDCIVADVHFTARIKGTDTEMALDYCGVSLIEDGKITRIKEFREHDDAVAYAEGFARGGS